MTNIGLLLIVLGWAYQLMSLLRGNKKIHPIFVGLYALGVLFLILGISPINISKFISLDGLSLIFAIIVLIISLKRK